MRPSFHRLRHDTDLYVKHFVPCAAGETTVKTINR